MLETAPRLLRLLALLPSRRSWSGAQLADELDVTTRTVRKDIERLRELGYPIDSAAGVDGGYRMGAGAELPPLLLDNEEATAVALGLRSLASGAITGIEETSLRTLLKLEQVMPPRIRRRVKTVHEAILATPQRGPAVDVDRLSLLAGACRDSEQLRFDYATDDETKVTYKVEPHRIVRDGSGWYLLAWDLEHCDWRTFRVERITPRLPLGPRFTPRRAPGYDAAHHVKVEVQRAFWDFRARVKVFTPAAELAKRVPESVTIEPMDKRSCIASVGSDSPEMLAVYLGMLGADFEVIDAPELRAPLAMLARRYLRAARSIGAERRRPRRKAHRKERTS